MPSLVFAGDPHGNFAPIVRACIAMQPGTLILLGDCDCAAPLRTVLRVLFNDGWRVQWILGNRDTDTARAYDNLTGSHPDGDFGSCLLEVNGVRIAGLAGVFKPRIWHPAEREIPAFRSRADFVASLKPAERWRGGLPLWHRDTIFPEDFDTLRDQRFDVLVTHEAPSSHCHGFAVIDELASRAGASRIVHGHHHQSYQALLASGIQVRGLGVAEIWELPQMRFPE